METSIVWFRNDLRLHDNEALFKAVKNTQQVIPVYCIDTNQFKTIDPNLSKTGWFRAKFLMESLQDLDNNLRKVGSGLIVTVGKPSEELQKIASKYKVTSVYTSKEVTTEEIKVEKQVENTLNSLGVTVNWFWQSTLYHLEDLPFPTNALPDIFTKFRKQVEKLSIVRETFSIPEKINSPQIPSLNLPSLKSLGIAQPKINSKKALDFKGGESEALKRLHHYFWNTQSLSVYKETRNGLLGADYSSKFSPWLANGCISPRYIYDEIVKYEEQIVQNDSTYWLIFELIWRDYFRFVAHKFKNKLFLFEGIKGVSLPLKRDIGLFRKWAEGKTGWSFIDANMIELNNTGFMSNRGRQNVASFLVKDLKLDWRWGAAYFESLLIDYDPCSNWGNWNYVAGIGNDLREDRYFNTLSQAKRYDSKGEYVKYWIPNLEKVPTSFVHNPSSLPKNIQTDINLEIGVDYPNKVINLPQENQHKDKRNYKNQRNNNHKKRGQLY